MSEFVLGVIVGGVSASVGWFINWYLTKGDE